MYVYKCKIFTLSCHLEWLNAHCSDFQTAWVWERHCRCTVLRIKGENKNKIHLQWTLRHYSSIFSLWGNGEETANEKKKEIEFCNCLFLSCLIEFCSNLFCLLILIGIGFSSPPFSPLVKLYDCSLKWISIIMRGVLMSCLYFTVKDAGQTS